MSAYKPNNSHNNHQDPPGFSFKKGYIGDSSYTILVWLIIPLARPRRKQRDLIVDKKELWAER